MSIDRDVVYQNGPDSLMERLRATLANEAHLGDRTNLAVSLVMRDLRAVMAEDDMP